MANKEIPKDRAAKAKLVKELMTGQKSIEDLEDDSFTVNMNLAPTDAEREEFSRNRELQESWKGDPSVIYLTVDIQPK